MDAFVRNAKMKRDIALATFLGSSVVFGVADLLLYRSSDWTSTSWVLNAIIGIVAIVSWCRYDSRVHGYAMTGGLVLLIWLLALIGVPLYLVRSRGWLGAAKLGFGLPAFALSIGLYLASWHGSYWVAARSGYFHQ